MVVLSLVSDDFLSTAVDRLLLLKPPRFFSLSCAIKERAFYNEEGQRPLRRTLFPLLMSDRTFIATWNRVSMGNSPTIRVTERVGHLILVMRRTLSRACAWNGDRPLRGRCWRGRFRGSALRSRLSLLDRRNAAHLIHPFFKRFFPTEINQCTDNDYFNKEPHKSPSFSEYANGCN